MYITVKTCVVMQNFVGMDANFLLRKLSFSLFFFGLILWFIGKETLVIWSREGSGAEREVKFG
jgi:hypothetical protein